MPENCSGQPTASMTEADLPAHAENSPSSAEGWTFCEGYINANRGLPDIQSWEAAEGTAAHWIRNECMMNGEDAVNYVGHRQRVGEWDFEWTDADARLLQPGIDWLRSHEGTFYGEHRVDLTEWLGRDSLGRPQGGTLDGGIICDDGTCIIDDEKWGRGVAVYPERNKQIMLYALGFGREHHIADPATRFILSIDQPRCMGGGGRWETTWAELLEFGEWIKERAAATRVPNAPRRASQKACQWCRRKAAPGGCETHDEYVMGILAAEFADLDEGVVMTNTVMTPERRSAVLLHKKMIEKWLEQLDAEGKEDALNGRPTPGMKIVWDARNPSTWLDKDATEAALVPLLGDKSFTKKLISPTEASKAKSLDDFDRLLIAGLTKFGERRRALVPLEDNRPAIVMTSADEFDDID